MTQSCSDEALFDAITTLALQISRASPESADKAMQILDLLQDLQKNRALLDRASVHDAIESEAVDSDWTDSDIERATDAVFRGRTGKT